MQEMQVGNAPCSWGTLEFGSLKADRISASQMLDELVESGYTGCELGDWGFFPTDPDELHALFATRQLTMTGAYIGIAFEDSSKHAAGEAEALKIAQQMATLAKRLDSSWSPIVVLAGDNGVNPVRTKYAGRIGDDMLLSPAGAQTFAQGVNRVAAAIHAQTGLRSALHNHCAGFFERPDEIEQILAMTDPELVGLVLDTGHYVYGAGNCDGLLSVFDRFADRIWYVHFKDCDLQIMEDARKNEWDYFQAVEHGVFCELGQGCVDFPGIIDWLQTNNYCGFVTVEQDVLPGMGHPYDSATRNRRYLADIEL
jgi:inosose dehydratase